MSAEYAEQTELVHAAEVNRDDVGGHHPHPLQLRGARQPLAHSDLAPATATASDPEDLEPSLVWAATARAAAASITSRMQCSKWHSAVTDLTGPE